MIKDWHSGSIPWFTQPVSLTDHEVSVSAAAECEDDTLILGSSPVNTEGYTLLSSHGHRKAFAPVVAMPGSTAPTVKDARRRQSITAAHANRGLPVIGGDTCQDLVAATDWTHQDGGWSSDEYGEYDDDGDTAMQ